MFCYDSPEYVKDMGTPDRYYSVCKDCKEGRISEKNLKHKQKAIFFDRDGTINKYVGFLRNIDEFELIDGVAAAIRKINESGYLAVVVTNQPVIARGEVSFEELEEIHNKMETLLGKEGAYLDAIYYCPHHPHKGYEGERPELKIECDCRKPKPGMLFKAAEDFNIDLSQSWMIGDGENDVKAGINTSYGRLNMAEDQLQSVALFQNANHIYYYNKVLYFYRDNGESITRKQNPGLLINSLKAKLKVLNMLENCRESDDIFELYYKNYYRTVNHYVLKNISTFKTFDDYKVYLDEAKKYDVNGLKRAKLIDRIIYKILFSENFCLIRLVGCLYLALKK